MKLIVLACCCLIFIGASQDKDRVFTTTIAPYKVLQNGAFYKFLSLHPEEGYVEHLSALDYEWGYTYKVKLKETHLENPPEDGSSVEYQLLKIISKEPVPADYSFKLTISRDLYLGYGEENVINLQALNDTTYRYMDEINILYTPSQQAIFDSILVTGRSYRGKFTFANSGYIRLQ